MAARFPSPSRRSWVPVAVALAAAVACAVLTRTGFPTAEGPRSSPAPAAPAAADGAPSLPSESRIEVRQVQTSSEDPFRQRFDEMGAQLEKEARRYPGRMAIYVKDLKRGWEWSTHADDLFPSASLIKLPIMIGVFEKISRGELALSQELTLKRRLRVGGSGSLKWWRDGSKLTVRQLIDHLIVESDNTAMRILIDEVGMGYLQRQFQQMGLVYTEIYPEGLSLQSGNVKYENFTTAREMSMLMEKIYRKEIVDPFSDELMLEILKHKRARSRLAKSLPVGWEIAHKTGLLRRACHDVSIVFSPDGDYVLTVLTGQNASYPYAKEYIARIGKITYTHYKTALDLYAKAGRRERE
ncbi:MAG: serine hydrolase [Elusimicrobiota bacterium]|jgi:beta-lactamase class A